jgi:hypothetical protein
MFRSAFLVILLIAAPTLRLLAQGPTVRSGERVRVEFRLQSERPLVGTVINVSHYALLLRIDSTDATVYMDSVVRLDVSRGRANRTANILKNGAAGLLVGAVGGAIAGPLVLSKDCYSSTVKPWNFGGCIQDLSDGRARLEAATYFGVTGALIGGLFGAILKTDHRWEEVPLDRLHVSFAPERDGFAVGVSVSF